MSSLHGLRQVQGGDIPTTNDDFIGVNEGEDLVHGEIDFFGTVATDLDGGGLGDGTVVVSSLFTSLGHPVELQLVGKETGSEGSTVVTTPTNEHDTQLGNSGVGLEGVFSGLGGDLQGTVLELFNSGGLVFVGGLDETVFVGDVVGVDLHF